MIFKIISKEGDPLMIYDVYAIKSEYIYGKIYFLVWDSKWKWVDASDFEPVEQI